MLSFYSRYYDTGKVMSYFTRKQRCKIALGGLLTLIGFMVLTFLVITRTIDVCRSVQFDLSRVLIGVIIAVGCLDVLAGILLYGSR